MSKTKPDELPPGFQYNGGGWFEGPGGIKVQGKDNLRKLVENNLNPSPMSDVAMDDLNDKQQRFVLLNAVRNALGGFGGRQDYGRRTGRTWHGEDRDEERDYFQELGYPEHGTIDWVEQWQRYQRQDIATTVVEDPPKRTWRNPPDMTLSEDDSDDASRSEFDEARGQIVRDLSLWSTFRKIDTLGRLGHYAVGVIGVADGRDPDKPVDPEAIDRPSDIRTFTQYSEEHADVVEWFDSKDDLTEPRFGMPKIYRIDLDRDISIGTYDDDNDSDEANSIRVHADRVIHVAENAVLDDVQGRPALLNIWNRLIDLRKILGPTAEGYWKEAERVWTFNIDPDFEVDDSLLGNLESDVMDLVHGMQRSFTQQGIDVDTIGGEQIDPEQAVDAMLKMIAAGTIIPKTILVGFETGERASTENMKLYFGNIEDRQEWYAQPIIDELFGRFQDWGILTGGVIEYEWPSLEVMSEQERADLGKTKAETFQIYNTSLPKGPLDLPAGRLLRDIDLPDQAIAENIAELEAEDQQILRDIEEAQSNGRG